MQGRMQEQEQGVVLRVRRVQYRPRGRISVHPVGMGNTRRTIKRVRYVKQGMRVRKG